MASFERGDVVRVPFSYRDVDSRQYRPALVVSRAGIGDRRAFLWVVMITSAAHRSGPGDVPIVEAYEDVGLPAPSLIRTSKIATIESRHADRIGRVGPELWGVVQAQVLTHLGIDEAPVTPP